MEDTLCINCNEYNSVEFNCGIGICRDDECIYVHNKDKPYVCILCGKNLHPDIIHKYCGSKITFNKINLNNNNNNIK